MIWLIGWVKTEFELNRVQSKLLMILYTWQQLRMVPLVWSSIQDGWMLPHMLWPRVILLRPATAGPPEALFCIVSIASLSFWRWGSKLPFQIAAQYSKWGTIAFLLTINWGEGAMVKYFSPHSPLLLDDHIRVLEKQMVQLTCTVVHTNYVMKRTLSCHGAM